MNKRQLIARVQYHMGPGATRETAAAAVESVLSSILSAVEKEKVHIPRFGTFERLHRQARRGFDIHRATACQYPPTQRLTFRPAREFLPELPPPPTQKTGGEPPSLTPSA